jgi:hypothetical protein
VDVGAGHGFFSLAAAARGHRVIAFETAPGSLAAFKASIAYNDFGSLIELRNTVLGAIPGNVCLQQRDEQISNAGAAGAAAATGSAKVPQQQAGGKISTAGDSEGSGGGTAGVFTDASVPAVSTASRDSARTGVIDSSGSSSSSLGRPQQRLLAPEVMLRRRRGYPQLTESSDTASSGSSSNCAVSAQRVRLSDALANITGVAVLRVSAHGHEGFIIGGALDFLKSSGKPDVVYIEFCPAAMRAAGYVQPKQLLQQMFELGYTDVAHAGRVCDKRWSNVTRGMRLQVGGAYGLLQLDLCCGVVVVAGWL